MPTRGCAPTFFDHRNANAGEGRRGMAKAISHGETQPGSQAEAEENTITQRPPMGVGVQVVHERGREAQAGVPDAAGSPEGSASDPWVATRVRMPHSAGDVAHRPATQGGAPGAGNSGGGVRRKRRKTRLPEESARAVIRRSRGRCEAGAPGCLKVGQHLHHRRFRSAGEDHSPANLLHVCRVCHEWIHANKRRAKRLGWAISSFSDISPALIPVGCWEPDTQD